MQKFLKKIKKYCQPREKFLKESKILFIKELHTQGVVTKNEPIRILLYRTKFNYILAVFLAIAVFSTGTVAFAEMQNVNATHPLYKLKRLGETVQVAVAPVAEKSQLHNKFAQRRLDEIKQIKSKVIQSLNSSSTIPIATSSQEIIDNLNEDFTTEVKATINEMVAPQTEKEVKEIEKNIKNTCQSINQKIKEHREVVSKKQEDEDWHEVEDKCGQVVEKNNGSKENNEKIYEDKKAENQNQDKEIKVQEENKIQFEEKQDD